MRPPILKYTERCFTVDKVNMIYGFTNSAVKDLKLVVLNVVPSK